MEAAKLRTVQVEANEETIALLRELLAEAEAGDLLTLSGVAEYRDRYRTLGTRSQDRLRTAGMLLEAAVARTAGP